MRRDPRIINLHDKPSHPRRVLAYRDDPPGYGTPLIACLAIVAFTGGFFWLYDAVAHRDAPFVPALTQPAAASIYTWRAVPAVPAPDMHAPAVTLANSDVPAQVGAAAAARDDAAQEPVHTAEIPRKNEIPRKKKTPHGAPEIPAEAARAFASGSVLDRPPTW
jgi:hypothetical protein